MKKLILMRHAESTGNRDGIIQGHVGLKDKYYLTPDGEEHVYSTIQQNKQELSDGYKVIASPARRTFQTGIMVSESLNMPMSINFNLMEFDAGILSDMKKEEAKKLYPKYYKIYEAKGDMDEIPWAESGSNFQARILGFLMQYYSKEDFCEIIVTHAGVIRYLINTVNGVERTTQIPMENDKIWVVDDIFKNIGIENKNRAMNSKVYIADTANEKYVVKIKEGEIKNSDFEEKRILEELNMQNLPRVLSLQKYEGTKQYCKVLKYVDGTHTYGELSKDEFIALIKSEMELEQRLSQIHGYEFPKVNLKDTIKNIYSTSKNEHVKKIAKELLISNYSACIENDKDYVLSHNDLNRDNILFQKDEERKC